MYGMDSPEGMDKFSFLGEPSLSQKYSSKEGVGHLDSNSQAVSVDTMEAENVDSGKNTKNQMAENEIHSGSTALMEVSGGPVGASKEERLIQLVQDYCSLPHKHRIHSTESKEIQSLSSYPMPDQMHPLHNKKEEFLLKVQPIVQEMEKLKLKDVMDTRDARRGRMAGDNIVIMRWMTAESWFDPKSTSGGMSPFSTNGGGNTVRRIWRVVQPMIQTPSVRRTP